MARRIAIVVCLAWLNLPTTDVMAEPDSFFVKQVAPILARRCVSCHSESDPNGELSLATASAARQGGESGAAIEAGLPDESLLVKMISGDEPEMPQDADRLTDDEVERIRTWIASGAAWPDGYEVRDEQVADVDWWSLEPLEQPAIPPLKDADRRWARTPIDAFILARLEQKGFAPSAEADRLTLIRRLYFDLVGLPPTPEEVGRFLNDTGHLAYERVVDDLLDSPRYGERWARHWLDVVHFGETHGYDKDKLRPNAWPYRDYVIRSFNRDTPYEQFVREQLAGDMLWPDSPDGIEATGFISAGPWDFIGHAEVPESKIDGQVARNLDRDDMVSSTMNTFLSVTVQCARCHNHKFDPITQEHYYSLQAVFAALDRADREYDQDAHVAARRRELITQQANLQSRKQTLETGIQHRAGDRLVTLDKKIETLSSKNKAEHRPQFGYHSQIASKQETVKWVQLELEQSHQLKRIIIAGCHDDFNNIGAGFGFPVRFKIEVSEDPEFQRDVVRVVDRTSHDFANPGVAPQVFEFPAVRAKYVRVTATRLATRQNDYIFALAELIAHDPETKNVAESAKISALDSIEAPVRWSRANLIDGYYRGGKSGDADSRLKALRSERRDLLEHVTDDTDKLELKELDASLKKTAEHLSNLPARRRVYAGTVHHGEGAFQGRGHVDGKPREIYVLTRGEVTKPGKAVVPGTIPVIPDTNWKFQLSGEHREGERRVALADWIVRRDNPLTWRSIVNRVWQYHYGRGIVGSSNDFGRMGDEPTHAKLLDWLAVWFRDNGQSLKGLHRLMVTSSVYRQVSTVDPNSPAFNMDPANRFLSRMNRRPLDAESIRDSVLFVSGTLDTTMYGPSFRDFVLERPEHSPHYEYAKHDPNDPKTHRRSVYRFLVRSQQQPFMQTLDCADPSQSVPVRDTSVTAVQALTLMNNPFMVSMAQHFASRIESETNDSQEQIRLAIRLAVGRDPTQVELTELTSLSERHGLANVCRVIFNLNEFIFAD